MGIQELKAIENAAASDEFDAVVEDLTNYEGDGLVTDEMIEYLQRKWRKRHPKPKKLKT